MAGRVQWEAQVDSNVAKLLSETKELRDQLDGIKKGNYEIKLNIDDKKLEKVISNLDKMLNSLGKGTGDFKEFENLSKQLNEIVSEVKELNKAFGGINDSGVSNLLSSIQSIDKSLSSLSEHITNVNKDFGSVGKNASDNVGQINEARKATEGLTEATKELANAQKNVGNKSNISSGNTSNTAPIQESIRLQDNLGREIDENNSRLLKGTQLIDEQNKGVLTLYHYSNELFDKFDLNASKRGLVLGQGAYFGVNDTDFKEVGSVLTQWYANIRRVFDIETSNLSTDEIDGFIKKYLVNATEEYCKQVSEELKQSGIVVIDTISRLSNELGIEYKELWGHFEVDAIKGLHTNNREMYNVLDPNRLFMASKPQFDMSEKISGQIEEIKGWIEFYEGSIKEWQELLNSPNPEDPDYFKKCLEEDQAELEKYKQQLLEVQNLQSSATPIKDTFQKQTPEIDNATNSVNKLVEAEKELVEVSKQAQNINLSNLGTSASGVAATVEKYQQGTARAPKNSKLLSSDAKLELGTELKRLQTEIIASIDSSTSFIKEVTDFYDSHNNLVKTQMKVLDKNNNMATYTTSYSVDKNGNANAWTSQILNDKGKGVEKRASVYKELLNTIKQYSEVTKRVAKNEALQGDLELVQKLEAKITELQKQPILSTSQIAESERRLVSLYDQLDTLEKKTAKEQSDKSSAQAAKEQAEAWEKNLKAIQEYMDANTKLNNLMAKDKGTGKHASDIARQEKEVEKLKESAIEARVALSSMVNPHETPIDDWRKWVEAMEKFEQATKGSAESVAKLEDALRSARNAQLSSIDSTIDNGQSKYEDFSVRKAQSDAYKNSLKGLNETLERLHTLRASLSNTRTFTDEEQTQIQDLTKSVHEYVKEIGRMSADEKGSNDISRFKLLDRIAEYMKKNTRMSREFKAELESLMDTLRTGDANVQTGDILTQFEKIKDRIRQAKQEGISFFDIFKNKAVYGFAARLAQYYLSFYDFIRYARYAFNSIREFDTALTEMRKVSDESVSSLERLQKASFDLADSVGTTSIAVQQSIADFMRLGESLEEATQSAQDANILLKVSEFDDISQATDALISMSAAYKDLEKTEINDVLNEVGNNYSISTDQLASALQKSAATLSIAGNDIYEAAALVTAGNAILQDADSVGAGMRTISLRILGTKEAKDELASLGEDVDDFVVQTKSKIDQTVRNYTAVTSNSFKGISVLDDNGNYRSTYEILRDISEVYQEILETDKKAGTNRGQALLEVLAGKNRSNVAASILQNPELLKSVYESASNSVGSAQEELDKYLESIDGRIEKLKNQLQEFWYNLIDSDAVKTAIDALTEILSLATNLVDTLGALGTIGLGAGLFAGIKNVGINMLVAC